MAITQNEFNVLMEQWLIDNGGQYSSAHTGAVIDAAVTAVKAKEASWDAKIGAFSVGTTVTGAPGTSASVTNSGTASEPILDFVIPKGQDGETGQDGFSPTIAEDESNSTTSYKLNISNKDGQFTTPNLRAVSFVENAQVYSQEEQVIGTWIDGKPLYRRVVVATVVGAATSGLQTQNTLLDCTEMNIETASKMDVVLVNPASSSHFPGGVYGGSTVTAGDAYFYTVRLLTGKTLTEITNLMDIGGYIAYITLEYTKTTDEATIATVSADELNGAYQEGVQSA